MKAPSGSRNDVARGSRRDAGEDEADRELRAMRSVWLAMRDEEPPDRGLAELLAAARTKAEAMQARPTLWQRVVAGLGRPPALALATVMVLLGGALIVGRRGVEVPAPARTLEAPAPLAAAPIPRKEPLQPGAPAPDGRAASMAGSAAAGPAGGRAAPVAGVATSEPAPGRPAPGQAAAKTGLASEDTRPLAAVAKLPPARGGAAPGQVVGESSPAAERRVPAEAAGTFGWAGDPAAREAPVPAAPASADRADHRPAADSAPGAAVRGDTERFEAGDEEREAPLPPTPPGPGPGPGSRALYEQCESAARRGDCVAVRQMVGRITKTDRGYRARLAKDSPVARCLAQ